MPIDAFLRSIEYTGFATTIRDSIWMFPIIESIHVICFTMVVGTIAIIDLRLLGVASTGRSIQKMESEILKWTWGAFALTVVTGLTMFSTNARIYYHNPFFRAKMILLLLAGINVLVFELTAGRSKAQWDMAKSAPRSGKAVAVLSLTMWIAIIFMGRAIGFTTHPGKVKPPNPKINYDNFLLPTSSGTSTTGHSPKSGSSAPPATTPAKK